MWKIIKQLFKDAKTYYIKLTSDGSGEPSLAKAILFWTAFTAGCVIWKLTVQGKLTIDFFTAFLVWGSGHQLTSKWLDTKGNVTEIEGKK